MHLFCALETVWGSRSVISKVEYMHLKRGAKDNPLGSGRKIFSIHT